MEIFEYFEGSKLTWKKYEVFLSVSNLDYMYGNKKKNLRVSTREIKL